MSLSSGSLLRSAQLDSLNLNSWPINFGSPKLGMEIYPGESVKLDPETWNLVALSNGRFTISTEKLSPFPDSPLYDKVKDGEVIYKPFVHVIGDPIEPLYKLKRIL
ncbi:unnamed protein product [Schistosoma margrebowiei]|uniref:Uncharacterized protein n=1 Tax=Schistosoma margrebowiei TaxID=48269 RepID=A0A183MHR0_9TREM|nr:unnamed protein product [Schistosoma margrebowiei]